MGQSRAKHLQTSSHGASSSLGVMVSLSYAAQWIREVKRPPQVTQPESGSLVGGAQCWYLFPAADLLLLWLKGWFQGMQEGMMPGGGAGGPMCSPAHSAGVLRLPGCSASGSLLAPGSCSRPYSHGTGLGVHSVGRLRLLFRTVPVVPERSCLTVLRTNPE